MRRRVLVMVAVILAAVVLFAAAGLTWAHLAIRRERGSLPNRMVVTLAPAGVREHPVRLTMINTASQPMPRAAVLDPARDPQPNAPYVMSHPSFVLEWQDGRILLIDAGMTREGAVAFGRLLEYLGGAQPIQPLTSVAERLGEARARVHGVIFTHLHTDHVGGFSELCAGLDHPIRVFMTEAQAERPNFTTRPGLTMVQQAPCAQIETLQIGSTLHRVPGFEGVFVAAAGGHTPGSQMVFTTIPGADRTTGYAFAGDIANNADGLLHNVPKPFLYSVLMVPEDWERLDELRRYLRDLHTGNNFALVVSHDQLALERLGIPAW